MKNWTVNIQNTINKSGKKYNRFLTNHISTLYETKCSKKEIFVKMRLAHNHMHKKQIKKRQRSTLTYNDRDRQVKVSQLSLSPLYIYKCCTQRTVCEGSWEQNRFPYCLSGRSTQCVEVLCIQYTKLCTPHYMTCININTCACKINFIHAFYIFTLFIYSVNLADCNVCLLLMFEIKWIGKR